MALVASTLGSPVSRDAPIVAGWDGSAAEGQARVGSTPSDRMELLSGRMQAESQQLASLIVLPLSGGAFTATDLAQRIMGGRGEISNAVFSGSPEAAGKFLGGRPWTTTTPADGAFDERVEDFSVYDARDMEVIWSFYDIEIEIKIGNKVKLTRTERVPIVSTGT